MFLEKNEKYKRHDSPNPEPFMFVRSKSWSLPQLVIKHIVNKLSLRAFRVS